MARSMAKKSKNHRRRSKHQQATQVNEEAEKKKKLASLLDQAEAQNQDKDTIRNLDPIDIKDETLNKVIQKFTLSAEDSRQKPIVIRTIKDTNDKEEREEDDTASHLEDDEDFEERQPISKRQQRISNKPSIAILKASVPYPELIEWFDCDAEWPFFNADIKTSHNVVGVPKHWQMKRGYLSGRSVLERRPFELPEIIKQTDIETMREAIPQGNENGTDNKKLKEIARARVQPKLGTLDLDYKRLYDAFFTLGKNWKPELLPFGDLYYENRQLEAELEWKKIKSKYRPGFLSEELREALQLQEGMLPPWCHEMNKLGLPKSYPDMKVCGINWDISNLSSSQYGYWPGDKSLEKSKKNLFGSLVSFDELEHGDINVDWNNSYSSDNDEDDEDGEDGVDNLASTNDGASVEVDETPKEVLANIAVDPAKSYKYDENKPLFTVLSESKSYEVDGSDISGLTRTYDTSHKRSKPDDQNDPKESKKQKLEEEPDFRF